MPRYSYTAVDARGKQTTGTLEASDQNEATAKIKADGFFPTRIVEAAAERVSKGGTAGVKKGGRVGTKTLTVFTRQLATLIDAGLPLLRSLKTLAKQEKNKVMRSTMMDLAQSVESGSNFSEALSQHPRIFDHLFVNMVRAGEAGGVMEVVLLRLAEFQEKAEKIKGKIFFAMIYPAVVMTVAVGILALIMVFVVPQFEKIFKDVLHGAPLPLVTEIVVQCSRFLIDQWYIVVPLVVVIVVGTKLFFSTAFGKAMWDRSILHVPIFGNLVSKTCISQFSRTLGTLITSGVPILQSLNITRDTASNIVVSQAIAKIHDSVKEGESVVAPMESSPIFPPMLVSMVQVGEETGQLPDMLVKVASVYEEEVDNLVGALTSILEPIMIVLLAVIVGVIVFALFMPMLSIMNSIQDASSSR
jgi:type IV pilus assembly protein PilC